MAEISIKLKIAERYYPLKIEAKDEENVRKAAKMINERIAKHTNNFSSADRQDLLAMCAIELASELFSHHQQTGSVDDTINSEISAIRQLLDC